MQSKIIIAGFLVIIELIVTACSVSKKSTGYINDSGRSKDVDRVILNTYSKNITDLGFYIQKGKLQMKEGNKKINFFYSVKYGRKDVYLMSIKAFNGYEALRIFINNDTILINDRVNKELLYGSRNDFEKMTGIPVEFLKICFGDIVDYTRGSVSNVKIDGNELIITGIIFGIETVTNISTENCKVSKVKLSNVYNKEEITVDYKKYKGDGHKIPVETIIYDSKRSVQLIIKNQKFIVPWYGDIDFVPGVNYKKRHI